MDTTNETLERILAVYPAADGVGFSVFEGPSSPIAFGVKVVKEDKNKESLRCIYALLKSYTPDVVVVDDYMEGGSRRSDRVENLIETIVGIAHQKKITTRAYSRFQVRGCFSRFGAFTKQQIAKEIAKQFPEFEPRLPQARKPARAEDPRMAIFDAAALAMTYYFFENNKIARAA